MKFPVSSGIFCTKAPIVVQCSRSKDAEGMSTGCRKNKILSPASVSLSRRHRRCRRHVGVAVMAQVVLEKPQAGRCSRVWFVSLSASSG